MAKPDFAPPDTPPPAAPLMETPADPPLDFVGPPDGVGVPGEVELPVNLDGVPPISDIPVDPATMGAPPFEAPPVEVPDMDGA